MSRRASRPIREALISAYRQQVAVGERPNHRAAARAAGVTRQTASIHFNNSLPSSGTGGPVPPIRDLLTSERAEADSARAADDQAEAATEAAATPVAPPPAPEGHAEAEARLLKVSRNAAEGAAATAVSLLVSLQPLTRAARKRLEKLAETGDGDIELAVRLHGELARSLATTATAIERLTNVQSVLSERPTVTTAVRVERGGERLSDEEVRRRADVVLGRLRARGLDLTEAAGSEPAPALSAVDVEVIPVAALEAAPVAPIPGQLAVGAEARAEQLRASIRARGATEAAS